MQNTFYWVELLQKMCKVLVVNVVLVVDFYVAFLAVVEVAVVLCR